MSLTVVCLSQVERWYVVIEAMGLNENTQNVQKRSIARVVCQLKAA